MAERREVLLDIQVRGRDAQKRLGEVTTALKKNSESLKELNRQYKAGEIGAEAYGDATAAVKLESAELRKEQSSLTRQITNTTKATKAAEGSNEQLRAQLSLLTKEYNSLSKEQRENTERGKELQIQTRAISDELKENERVVGDNRRNVGNYQSALDGLGAALDRVIPGFSGIVKGAADSNTGFGKLIGSSGKLSGVAGKLGKALGGPLVAALVALVTAGVQAAKAIADITREFDPLNRQVNQLTGAQGESLNDLTAQVKGLADTFGQDFNEVLRAANTTANAFGISIDEALEQIGEGFLNGADASGEYLSVLQEYPAQLASVGLSLEEANALILTQTQEGIFSDKGIDAIKEAGIRLRELTPATREALDGIGIVSEEVEKGLREGSVELFDVIQQVGGRLGELEANSPEVGAAISGIFGGAGEDAGLDYLRLLGDIDGDLSDVTRASEEFVERQRRDLEVTEELSRAKSELAASFAPVVSLFDRFGKQVLTFVIERVNDIVFFFTTVLPASFEAAQAGLTQLGENIANFVRETVLDLQIAGKQIESFFSFSEDLEREIESLKSQRDSLADEYKSFGEAAGEAFNEGILSRRVDVAAVAPTQRTAGTTRTGGSTSASSSTGSSAEDAAKDAARAEEQRQREILRVQKAAIEQRIAEEELGLLKIEEATLLSDERKNELRLQREQELINLRAQLALNGLEEESAQARLIVAQSEAEIAQIQIDESNRVLGIKLDNAQAEREAIAANAATEAAAADARARQTEEQVARERAAAIEREQLEKQVNQQKVSLAGETFAAAADLLGEETALGKAAAIASATIATYQSAAQALANPPGPPFTIPLAALAVAAGFKQIKEIAAVNTSFADGGYTGPGIMPDRRNPGHRIAGVVHDGEYVVPRNVVGSSMAQPALSYLEGMRQRGSFANGGFAGAQAAARQTESVMNQGQDLINAISRLPNPVVSVREIDTVQNRVKVKQNTGL